MLNPLHHKLFKDSFLSPKALNKMSLSNLLCEDHSTAKTKHGVEIIPFAIGNFARSKQELDITVMSFPGMNVYYKSRLKPDLQLPLRTVRDPETESKDQYKERKESYEEDRKEINCKELKAQESKFTGYLASCPDPLLQIQAQIMIERKPHDRCLA